MMNGVDVKVSEKKRQIVLISEIVGNQEREEDIVFLKIKTKTAFQRIRLKCTSRCLSRTLKLAHLLDRSLNLGQKYNSRKVK